MNNIHILPSGNQYIGTLSITPDGRLHANPLLGVPHHLYITSTEKIKDGNWCIHGNTVLYKESYHKLCSKFTESKKIILTTDPGLIKDGVQAIDDEFLEWFCKNPNCKYIPTPLIRLCENCEQQFCDNGNCRGYNDKPIYLIAYPDSITEEIIIYCDGYRINPKEIITPKKEEPEPHSFCETPDEKCTMNYCDENGCQNRVRHLVELKQETLEEAAEKHSESQAGTFTTPHKTTYKHGFEDGAKWQSERIPSIIKEFLNQYGDNISAQIMQNDVEKWVEQFKKNSIK